MCLTESSKCLQSKSPNGTWTNQSNFHLKTHSQGAKYRAGHLSRISDRIDYSPLWFSAIKFISTWYLKRKLALAHSRPRRIVLEGLLGKTANVLSLAGQLLSKNSLPPKYKLLIYSSNAMILPPKCKLKAKSSTKNKSKYRFSLLRGALSL